MSRQDFFALRLAFIAELELVQARIGASRCQQLAMSSALHDTAAVEHENLRRMLDRGETMGDDEDGPSLEQAIDRFLNEPLRFGIERGGSLIEDENRRIDEERARDRDALPLSARQAGAALSEQRV